MYGKWVCFVVLGLIILTYSTPRRFYHDHSGHDKPTWDQDWQGWWHDWFGGHTTKRAKTKVKISVVPSRESKRSTTPPQPTISDIEIRLGEDITTKDAPSSQSIQAEQDRQTLQVKTMPDASSFQVMKAASNQQTLQAFTPEPEDGETSVAATSVKTMPDGSSSQFVKAEAPTDQKKIQAFAPVPGDGETSVAAASVKTMPDGPSSQFVKAEAPADQKKLQAFAPGPGDGETSVAAASVKTMPDSPSSQFVKAEAPADQKKLQAFAPGPVDGETSVAAETVKTMPDGPSSQFEKAEALANQQILQAFAPGPEDEEKSVAAASVKTMPDSSSSQFVKGEANQQTLQAFAPGPEDEETSVAAASVKTMPDGSSSQFVKGEANQQTLQAFAPGPEDEETSAAAASVKTMPDGSSTQFVKGEANQQTLQAFAPGPEDEETSVAAASIKTMPDGSSSQFVKGEANQQTLQAFAPGPEDEETSVAAASIKTMPDGSSSQFVKGEANQQTLQAFAPGPEDEETSAAAASVKTMPDGSSSQFVKGEANQQTLQAFAPGPEDEETSAAAASVKTMPDGSSSQFVKAEVNQLKLQAFAPGPEDGETSVAAASVKTMPDGSSSQFMKAEAPTDQKKLQAFAPGPGGDGETSVAAASIQTMPDSSSSRFVKEKTTPGSENGTATAAWQSLKRLVGSSFYSIQNLTEQQKADALYKAQNFGPDGEYEDVKRLLDAATVNPEASGLEAKPDGKTSLWHVAIYREIRGQGSREYACGGSLVKKNIVVSTGGCFWSYFEVQFDANMFRVAAGKIHPGYDDPRDTEAQYSDVEKITITKMERPCYQPNLAVVNLATPFKYTDAVKPLCVKFFWKEEQQLKKGNYGTVPSWAEYEEGVCLPLPSDSLHWLSLPFVEQDVCQVETTSKTSGRDRICAGEWNNKTHCDADFGNGLVFYLGQVPYLRGLATDTYTDAHYCTEFYTRSYTDIIGGANHLKRLLKQINEYVNLEECEDLYKTNPTEAPKTTVFDYGDGVPPSGGSGQQFGIQAIGAKPVPVLEGTRAPSYQWHVGIYSKAWVPFMQICGGTLVKRDFVISAAHCFWDDTSGQQPASQFAVAGGKLFRPWNNTQDTYAQHSNVSRIILPVRFRGSATSFQDDIAILRLSSPFTHTPGVQPACVSFDATFERTQLQPLKLGKVLGWGLTEENGRPSQRLNYIDLPYVDVEDCFTDSEPAFMKFITSDKICAGDTYSGHALCRGDSGGGYVIDSGATPYIHGVASTAAGNQNLCNAFAIAAITSTYSHRGFIRDNIPDIEKECADSAGTESYGGAGNVVTGDPATGNVGSTGNEGLDVMGGTLGNPVTVTPVFSQLPYYPNHFVCNCNCKS